MQYPGRATFRRRMVAAGFAAITACVAIAAVDARLPWLWHWAGRQLAGPAGGAITGPTHIFFVLADHFEATPEATAALARSYRQMATGHRDSTGRPPQTTWFWSYDDANPERSAAVLAELTRLMFDGFGEVELRLQHPQETATRFQSRLERALALAARYGALFTATPAPRAAFGFVHGKWALDNSRPEFCGVNDEITRLLKAGCFADFTSPSGGKMHARLVNTPFYAVDDPSAPKSYDSGPIVSSDSLPPASGLMILPGPSVPRLLPWPPQYDRGAISWRDPATARRVDSWIQAGVHVAGKPEWLFVRPYIHGGRASNRDVTVGLGRDQLHTYLEERYADGTRYVLHYVTAREAYNLARAAEAGMLGDPDQYRDFAIAGYAASELAVGAPYTLTEWTPGLARLRFGPDVDSVAIELRRRTVIAIEGTTGYELQAGGRRVHLEEAASLEITLRFDRRDEH